LGHRAVAKGVDKALFGDGDIEVPAHFSGVLLESTKSLPHKVAMGYVFDLLIALLRYPGVAGNLEGQPSTSQADFQVP
jgi:hypothetical protein